MRRTRRTRSAAAALDLFVLHRRAHEVSLKEAGIWSAMLVWAAVNMLRGSHPRPERNRALRALRRVLPARTGTATTSARSEPTGVVVDPNTGTVYVAAGAVLVSDEATDTVTATIPVGGIFAEGLAVDPGTGTVYVAIGGTLGDRRSSVP